MTHVRSALRLLPILALGLAIPLTDAMAAPRRIVSVGGSVTETLIALGMQDQLVAVDTTSNFPEKLVEQLPKVGYMRQLSAEGVLSLRPTDVLAIEGTGPADALSLIREAGLAVTSVPERFSPDGVEAKIRTIGARVGKTQEAEALAQIIQSRFKAVQAGNGVINAPVRVLFALSVTNGRLMAAGKGTAADEAIRLAGAVNAIQGVDGYKPLADEAVIAAAPDAVVVMDRGGQPASDILAYPALATTPAARSGQLIAMDGMYLLGFGPRAPQAIAELRGKLYPALAFPALDAAP